MSVEQLNVRPANPDDGEAIARVHIGGWQEAYAGLLPDDFLAGLSETFDRRRQFWGRVAGSPGDREALLVAELGDQVVGFAHACPSRDSSSDTTTGEVTAIYLRKAYWGRGVGRRLFAAAVERLRASGFEDAILWVLDGNQRARRFYRDAGWETDGGEKEDRVGDLTLREVRYRRQL